MSGHGTTLTEDSSCPGCGGALTRCDCDHGEHLICFGCGDDPDLCDCGGAISASRRSGYVDEQRAFGHAHGRSVPQDGRMSPHLPADQGEHWQVSRATPTLHAQTLSLQRTIFWAEVSDDAVQYACRLGKGWRHALSADLSNYPDDWAGPTHGQLQALKSASGGVDAWGNQLEIPADQISDFAVWHDLDRRIYQAETGEEFDSAANAYARHLIGNPNAWTDNQRAEATALIGKGQLAVSGEVYDGRPDTYSAQGVPVSSLTLGVSLDGGLHYPLEDLIERTPIGARASVCIWHGSGLAEDEWKMLATL